MRILGIWLKNYFITLYCVVFSKIAASSLIPDFGFQTMLFPYYLIRF